MCDVSVAPKLLEFLETSSDLANPGGDVCERAAVIPEGDSKVFGSVLVGNWCVVCEVDWKGGVHLHVDTFGCVELEVVEFGHSFNVVECLLHCGVVPAHQDGVICIGKVEERRVDTVESW